jgi:hypothetical protein
MKNTASSLYDLLEQVAPFVPVCKPKLHVDIQAALDRGVVDSKIPPDRPRIVCLCGSTRFYDAFQKANYDETMAGRIVLSVGFYPHTPGANHGEGVGHDSAEKVALDELHKRKIDLADEVLVLNVGGYVGSSTKSEIDYAIEHKKPIRWLEIKLS